ncbi:MAG: hypothetical protein ACRDZ5_05525 [Acidimicrobiales bacterium]
MPDDSENSSPPTGKPLARSSVRTHPPVGVHLDWEVSRRASSAPLRLSDLSPLTKIEVCAPPGTKPTTARKVALGRAERDGEGNLVVGSRPDRVLVLAPAGRQRGVLGALEAERGEGLSAIIDVTHGRALFRLTGTHAKDALEKICAIDLCDAVTPNGAAFRSSVARVVTDVVRDDVGRGGVGRGDAAHDDTGAQVSYLLSCERSSGQYLFDAVLDAGSEFAADVDGFPEKEI